MQSIVLGSFRGGRYVGILTCTLCAVQYSHVILKSFYIGPAKIPKYNQLWHKLEEVPFQAG